MKKLNILLLVVLFGIIYIGCSDDTVTQNIVNKLLRYSITSVPDTLIISFEAIDSNFTTADSANVLQFSAPPKVFYEINAKTGYGNFALKNNLDSTIFYKMFGGYVSDTATLLDIPGKYVFKTTNFTGKGNIRVTR